MKLSAVFVLILTVLLTAGNTRAAAPQCSSIFSAEKTIENVYESFKTRQTAIMKNTTSLQHLKAFYEYQRMFAQASQDKSSPLFDPQFKEILLKTLNGFKNKSEQLTVRDLEHINASSQRKKLFEGVLYYQTLIEAPLRLIQQYAQYTATRGGSIDFLTAPTTGKKAQHFLQSFYNGPLKYMLLVPHNIDLPGGVTPTQKVFKKLWQNSQYVPNAAELAVLKQYKSERIFEERKAFLNEHRHWVKIRRLGDYALTAILAVSLMEAYSWYEQLNDPAATVDVASFLDDNRYQLGADEVRVYNETVPFPHMAIEIDGLVYSYGQTHMTVKTAREYLLSEIIEEGLTQPTKEEDPTWLSRIISTTGLNKMERVVQTARLNVGKNAKDRLKRYLEMQTGKRYRNHTLVMDCASMVVKALKENAAAAIPTIIDPSPSQVMFYLGSLKTLKVDNSQGRKLVTELLQVKVGKTPEGNSNNHLWRNLYINMMETRVYWSFVHFSAAQRTYLEARYGKDLQYWDDETLDYFKLWEKDIRQEFEDQALQGQLSVFRDSLRTQDPQLREALKMAIDAYFRSEEATLKAVLEGPYSRFEEIYRATLQLQLLTETKEAMYCEAGLAQKCKRYKLIPLRGEPH